MEYYEAEQLQQELNNLIVKLQSPVSPIGDWKIAKYEEYAKTGKEPPYDINELHARRQAVRDRINEIRELLQSAAG